MKTLAHKVIIYDDVCPLCKAYTNGFVNIGWLLPENRIGFSEAPIELLNKIDIERARHEIPLFDTETGETLYGKEALFHIIGAEMPVFKPLFSFPPFRFFIYILYQIITYNRRIIAGSKAPDCGFDCAPDFNPFYRWLYIGLVGFISLISFFRLIETFDSQAIAFILLLFAAILRGVLLTSFKIKTDYFGHLATVFMIVLIFAHIIKFTIFTMPLLCIFGFYLLDKRVKRLTTLA
jgi:predicted DCC family thiol-disulfide oxidoreductase YuxK